MIPGDGKRVRPLRIELAVGGPGDPPVLAFGADLDASVCAAAGGRAHLSPLDMDLTGPGEVASLREEAARLASRLGSPPGGADLLIAHDGDAGLRSSGCALERAAGTSPSSTITPISRRSSPSTGSAARWWARSSTGRASAPTAPSGEASC
ncbi:MAG: hypothetical protein U0R24_05055 [Solirubrobacterales bacterium]